MKFIVPLLFFISTSVFGQTADFIQLKKNGKTIATYFSGSEIMFTSTTGTFIDARINQVQHDTLFLQEFIIRKLPTTLGTYIIDTAGSYHYKFHYNQVKMIGREEKTNFNMRGSGASLLGGGVLLTLASGVVYLVDRKKFSAPLLGAAVALGTAGYFMAKGKGGGYTLGRKYKLVYMDMSDKKR